MYPRTSLIDIHFGCFVNAIIINTQLRGQSAKAFDEILSVYRSNELRESGITAITKELAGAESSLNPAGV